jgi:hypothetical protein
MQDFNPQTSYLIFAQRGDRGWKLAHGNLQTEAAAWAARDEIGKQDGVLSTRLVRVTNETLIEG